MKILTMTANYQKIFLSFIAGISFLINNSCQNSPFFNAQIEQKDLTPPQVVSISPVNNTTEVSDKPVITVVFNEDMDAATLNSATLTIKTSSGSPGFGAYSYNQQNFTLTVNIVQSLYLNTMYTVALTDGIKDRAGNSLTPVESKFSTDVCPKAKAGNTAFNGSVKAIAKIGCILYFGGNFTQVGTGHSHFSILDEASGEVPFDFYYPFTNGDVDVAIADGNNGYYIAGSFTRVGGLVRQGLAQIGPGGEVLPWNPSVTGVVRDIVKNGNTIFLGGTFTQINNQNRNHIAAVDVNGQLLPFNPDVSGALIYSIKVTGSNLIIGGTFSSIKSIARNNIAMVSIDNGCISNFTSACVTSWNPDANSTINSMAVYNNAVYIGGSFQMIGGDERKRLAALNIDSACTNSYTAACLLNWNPNANASISNMAINGTTMYIGGYFTEIGSTTRKYLAALNIDSTCTSNYTAGCLLAFNPEINGNVSRILFHNNKVFITGGFDKVGCASGCTITPQQDRKGFAVFENTTLLAFHPGNDTAISTMVGNNTQIFIGGSFKTINGKSRNRLAAVDTSGQLLSWNPNANASVETLIAVDATIYVGGSFTNIGGSTRNRLAAIDTDGIVQSFNPNVVNNVVQSIVYNGTHLFIGGNFTSIGCASDCSSTPVQPRNRVASVNTAGVVQSFNPNVDDFTGVVTTIKINGSQIYIGGSFESVSGQARNNIALLDSTGSLQSFNPNVNDRINTIEVFQNKIYLGGDFSSVNGQPRGKLAAIDSSGNLLDWANNLAFATSDSIYNIVSAHDRIYLTGYFFLNDSLRTHLASIDESGEILSWNPHPNSAVYNLLVSGSTIYAGGAFTAMNNNTIPSFKISSINSDGTVNW